MNPNSVKVSFVIQWTCESCNFVNDTPIDYTLDQIDNTEDYVVPAFPRVVQCEICLRNYEADYEGNQSDIEEE